MIDYWSLIHFFLQETPQELEIRFKFEPYINFYGVVCLNSTTLEKQSAKEAEYFACNMSVRDGKIFFMSFFL